MLKRLTQNLIYPSKNDSFHKKYVGQSKLFKNHMKKPSYINLSCNRSCNNKDNSNLYSSREINQTERIRKISLNKGNISKEKKLNQSTNLNSSSLSKIKQIKIESANTLDTSRRMKVLNSGSMTTSNKRTLQKSYSHKDLGKKFLTTYLQSINKSSNMTNNTSRTNISQIESAKQDFDENINILEQWIDQIKDEGFYNNNKLIEQKQRKLTRLLQNIKCCRENLNSSRLKENKRNISSSKERNLNLEIKNNYIKIKEEVGKYTNEINQLKKEIEAIGPKTKEIKYSTIIYGEEAAVTKKDIDLLNENIRKLNLKISEVKKQKDKILTSKLVIDKAIFALKEKTNDKIKTASHFMLNVHKLIEEKQLFNNK